MIHSAIEQQKWAAAMAQPPGQVPLPLAPVALPLAPPLVPPLLLGSLPALPPAAPRGRSPTPTPCVSKAPLGVLLPWRLSDAAPPTVQPPAVYLDPQVPGTALRPKAPPEVYLPSLVPSVAPQMVQPPTEQILATTACS